MIHNTTSSETKCKHSSSTVHAHADPVSNHVIQYISENTLHALMEGVVNSHENKTELNARINPIQKSFSCACCMQKELTRRVRVCQRMIYTAWVAICELLYAHCCDDRLLSTARNKKALRIYKCMVKPGKSKAEEYSIRYEKCRIHSVLISHQLFRCSRKASSMNGTPVTFRIRVDEKSPIYNPSGINVQLIVRCGHVFRCVSESS